MSGYGEILRLRQARNILLLGILVRVPMWAGMIVLTLHVVSSLGRSYGEAGVVTAAATIAAAVSGPWRGRRLDRFGLRRTIFPSLIVLTVCWSIAPFVGYLTLIPLVFVAGLFVVPHFSIVRQVLIGAVRKSVRTSALALDAVAVELSFMIGPALGVFLATSWNTAAALLTCELLSVAGGLLMYLINPSMGMAEIDGDAPAAGVRSWMSARVVAIIGASMAATIVLTGTDVGIVAALREWNSPASIGWLLTIWGAGSAAGGLTYGALKRKLGAFSLVGLLGLSTAPLAFVTDRWSMAILLFVSGVFCAPTITATIDALSRAVPEAVRGEALGWQGSALTGGSAIGAPAIGFAIDRGGWPVGFLTAGALGVAMAIVGLGITWFRGRSADATPTRPRMGTTTQRPPPSDTRQAGVPPGSRNRLAETQP